MNKSLKALDVIIGLLKGCWYRIVGGYAISGYFGSLSRPHPDVDLIILEEELDKVKEILRKSGYSFSLFNYKISLKVDGIIVDLGRFQRDQENYWLVTLPDHKWPVELLRGKEVTLEGIRFLVPSKEFLLSTKFSDQRNKCQNDRRILKQLGADIETAKKYQFPYHKHLTNIEAMKTNRDSL